MAFLELTRELDFIDSEIDDYHRRMVALLNALYVQHCVGTTELFEELLEELTNTTEEHFVDEERAMEAMRYPALDEHRSQHQRLLNTLIAVRQAHSRGEAALDEEMFEFLRSWLLEHIQRQDKPFDIFMRQRQ